MNSQHSESTALLGNTPIRPGNRTLSLLPVCPSNIGPISDVDEPSTSASHVFPTEAAKTAFDLIVLLQSFANEKQKPLPSRDVWDRWSKEIDVPRRLRELERHTLEVWSLFLQDYRSTREIEELLWLELPVEDRSPNHLRVVDCIQHVDAPEDFLSHPVVYLSLLRTWKHGHLLSEQPETSLSAWLMRRLDAQCTPRVLHCIDLLCRLVFLATLVHFLLHPDASGPIDKTSKDVRLREAFLIIYPLTIRVSPWSLYSLSFMLVLVTFFLNWPNGPRPGDGWFTTLHLALAIQILQLHAPYTPSPVFLPAAHRSLPLSALLSYGTYRIFLPVLMYFLPVTLFVAFILSLSLTDTFFYADFLPLGSPPIETRSAFLAIFATVVLVLISSLFILLVTFPPCPSLIESTPWDRYSKHIGLDARRAFVRAVVSYGTPYMFPPPFNIVQLILSRFPLAVLRRYGNRDVAGHFLKVERVLWRILIVPVAILVGGLWSCGLQE